MFLSPVPSVHSIYVTNDMVPLLVNLRRPYQFQYWILIRWSVIVWKLLYIFTFPWFSYLVVFCVLCVCVFFFKIDKISLLVILHRSHWFHCYVSICWPVITWKQNSIYMKIQLVCRVKGTITDNPNLFLNNSSQNYPILKSNVSKGEACSLIIKIRKLFWTL